HLAVDAHDPFGAQLLGLLEGRTVGIGDALRDAVMVAQVDEQEPAMIADAVAPAGQPRLLPDIAIAKRAAGLCAVAMHESIWTLTGTARGQAHAGGGLSRRAKGFCHRTA